MTIELAGRQLGDAVAVASREVAAIRTIPDLAPGEYALEVVAGDLVIARSAIAVTEEATAELSLPLMVWIGPPAMAALLWLVWSISQSQRAAAPNADYGSALAERTRREAAPGD